MSRDWYPLRNHPDYARRNSPQIGDTIAINGTYHPWVVADIRTYDEGDASARIVLALRKIDTLDLAESVTAHIGVPKLPHPALHVLPERYALCSCCGELAPCSAEVEDRTIAAMAARDARYETPGICPACMEVIGTRQQTWTCSTNLHVPLGPPVTFHRRGKCWPAAIRYEAAVANLHRVAPRFSCHGHLSRHLDRPTACTNDMCPGEHAEHRSYDATCLYRRCTTCAAIQTTTTEKETRS